MNFLMFGAPMAGKGTLANALAEEYKLPTISMGELLRNTSNPTVKEYQAKGIMVPMQIVLDVIKERLSQDDVKNGYILDGFPRTPEQLTAFVEQKIADINVVVNLEVPYETLLERVTGRRTCKECGYIYNTSWGLGYETCPKCGGEWGIRSDDNEETYKTRFDVYMKETLPILDYFKKEGKVVTVQGEAEPEQSYNNMINAFKSSNIAGLKEFIEG
jgi:adenylate kinase